MRAGGCHTNCDAVTCTLVTKGYGSVLCMYIAMLEVSSVVYAVVLLKLSCQREGLIFHRISAAALSSSIPYVGWIKCTMNLYSKWTGK